MYLEAFSGGPVSKGNPWAVAARPESGRATSVSSLSFISLDSFIGRDSDFSTAC
jgi:hypothetical protein